MDFAGLNVQINIQFYRPFAGPAIDITIENATEENIGDITRIATEAATEAINKVRAGRDQSGTRRIHTDTQSTRVTGEGAPEVGPTP